jgi:hypothetical protein
MIHQLNERKFTFFLDSQPQFVYRPPSTAGSPWVPVGPMFISEMGWLAVSSTKHPVP